MRRSRHACLLNHIASGFPAPIKDESNTLLRFLEPKVGERCPALQLERRGGSQERGWGCQGLRVKRDVDISTAPPPGAALGGAGD